MLRYLFEPGFFSSGPVHVALAVGTAGAVSAGAPFWQFPPMLLTGSAAAGGVALINSVGSFSGAVAPFVVGWLGIRLDRRRQDFTWWPRLKL